MQPQGNVRIFAIGINEQIHGDSGVDTVVFRGRRSQHVVTPLAADGSLVEVRTRFGGPAARVATLSNVERLQFRDRTERTASPGRAFWQALVSTAPSLTPAGATSPSERPITYVDWFDAARFANWMANGQPTGRQSPRTTENGGYNLTRSTGGIAVARNAVNPNTRATPTFFIPTESEWYQAAYYTPSKAGGAVTLRKSTFTQVTATRATNDAGFRLLGGRSDSRGRAIRT